jgi:hypothetical protein
MQKGHVLEFCCVSCAQKIHFSIFELETLSEPLECTQCSKQYALNDETLRRQLKKFTALCQQLIESEEILSATSVGVNVGEKCVTIPYKLLLTRLSSSLELMIGGKPISISFRLEPFSEPIKGQLTARE